MCACIRCRRCCFYRTETHCCCVTTRLHLQQSSRYPQKYCEKEILLTVNAAINERGGCVNNCSRIESCVGSFKADPSLDKQRLPSIIKFEMKGNYGVSRIWRYCVSHSFFVMLWIFISSVAVDRIDDFAATENTLTFFHSMS